MASWSSLILSHYAPNKIEGAPRVSARGAHGKPRGFWVSVDGKDDWLAWCLAEDWGIPNLAYRHCVTLRDDANIIHLQTEEEVFAFGARNGAQEFEYGLDWAPTMSRFDGIIIAPYQWGCRLHNLSCWYYGWDCASGCIWNASAIESVALDPEWRMPRKTSTAA